MFMSDMNIIVHNDQGIDRACKNRYPRRNPPFLVLQDVPTTPEEACLPNHRCQPVWDPWKGFGYCKFAHPFR